MTHHARVVLQDARHAIMNHNDELQAEAFRVSWFSIVGLLRAVGHVLDKLDKLSSPEMKHAIESKWADINSTKPNPKIYWEFIDKERNRFLKNYEHGITRTLTIPGSTKGFTLSVDCGNSRGGQLSPGSKLNSYISDGEFKGRYEKDLAIEAYDWWGNYLDEVDLLASKAIINN